jgi:proteasome lid subunit RPN8/RPN11
VGGGSVAALKLPGRFLEVLLEEARRSLPNECCGLLGGHGRAVARVFPASNQLASPVAYEIPPQELFDIFRRLRAERLELVGIYHSHPAGDNTPSARDRQRAYYRGVAHLILSPHLGAQRPVRAFLLEPDGVEELTLEVVD